MKIVTESISDGSAFITVSGQCIRMTLFKDDSGLLGLHAQKCPTFCVVLAVTLSWVHSKGWDLWFFGLFHCLISLVKAEICVVLEAALSWVYSKGQGPDNVEVYIGWERVLVSFFSIAQPSFVRNICRRGFFLPSNVCFWDICQYLWGCSCRFVSGLYILHWSVWLILF